jgi:acyl dehydratase
MAQPSLTFDTMKDHIGEELGVSDWITIDQGMIDTFADCTNDHQWIHVDVERARRESPYGAPVAHGFLTLSLIAGLSCSLGARPQPLETSINYGLDRLRFITPVKVGARVRLRSVLMGFDERDPGQYLMKTNSVVEIEGEEKPALVAETLALLVKGTG